MGRRGGHKQSINIDKLTQIITSINQMTSKQSTYNACIQKQLNPCTDVGDFGDVCVVRDPTSRHSRRGSDVKLSNTLLHPGAVKGVANL